MMQKNILLIGCGNIGLRHLQALTLIGGDYAKNIVVVEPNADLHESINAAITAANSNALFKFQIHSEMKNFGLDFDIAILATNAGPRFAILEKMLSEFNVGAVILEKVVFQNEKYFEMAKKLLVDHNIEAYVNCGRRGFPTYENLVGELSNTRPLNISISGSNFGLGSNAVHFLDLAEYLNGSPLTKLDGSGLETGFVKTKRQNCVEIFGTITGQLANGAALSVTCINGTATSVQVHIEDAEGNQIQINELTREIVAKSANGETSQSEFQSYYVSQTPFFYQSILDGQGSLLTDFEDSTRQHLLYLDVIRKHLNLSSHDDVPIS